MTPERRVNNTILQTFLPPVPTQLVTMLHRFAAAKPLPKSFDWREKTTLCPVVDQHQCGACWCFSATSAFTDRLRINGKSPDLILDPLQPMVCIPPFTPEGGICGGGLPENAFQFFEKIGASVASGTCYSWDDLCKKENCMDATDPPNFPECSSLKCDDKYIAEKGSTHSLYVLDDNGVVNIPSTILAMKTALLDGPIVGKIMVFADFMVTEAWKKTNGIYINGAYDGEISPTFKQGCVKASTCVDGGHAIEIVGWGVGDAGGEYGVVDYWIIKNSWGTKWQDKGYGKIAMTNKSKNIIACGLDAPLQEPRNPKQLFGGAVACNIAGSGGGKSKSFSYFNSSTPQSSSSDDKNIIWWVLAILAILSLLVLILKIKMKR